MDKIISDDFLAGIMFWAQFYSSGGYRIYRYIGRNEDSPVYHFMGLKDGTFLTKSVYQLYVGGFKPYCYDTKRVREYLTGDKEEPDAAI